MEANRRNADDGIALRMSQASNKDMASGGTGSMVQDEGTGGIDPFSDESEDATSNDHSDDDQSMPSNALLKSLSKPIQTTTEPAERAGG